MKTLIIYASKYGYTEELVKKMIVESNNEFDSININSTNKIDLSKYEGVILGSSIYIGQMNRKLKDFVSKNLNVLMDKKISLFLACGSEENFDLQVKNNFPEALVEHASSITYLGGKIQKEKLNFFYKFIISNIEKSQPDAKPYPMYPNRTLDIVNQFNRA